MRVDRRARSVAFIVALVLVVGGGNLLWTAHAINANNARSAQQGEAFERKLCTTLAKQAAAKPPPGNPDTNPSRAYLQHQYAILAELGPDIGCKP